MRWDEAGRPSAVGDYTTNRCAAKLRMDAGPGPRKVLWSTAKGRRAVERGNPITN